MAVADAAAFRHERSTRSSRSSDAGPSLAARRATRLNWVSTSTMPTRGRCLCRRSGRRCARFASRTRSSTSPNTAARKRGRRCGISSTWSGSSTPAAQNVSRVLAGTHRNVALAVLTAAHVDPAIAHLARPAIEHVRSLARKRGRDVCRWSFLNRSGGPSRAQRLRVAGGATSRGWSGPRPTGRPGRSGQFSLRCRFGRSSTLIRPSSAASYRVRTWRVR